MADQSVLERADLVEMLAEMNGVPSAEVPDRVGSMELAWLVHLVEQRHGQLDLTDDQLAGIRTISDALAVFRVTLGTSKDG